VRLVDPVLDQSERGVLLHRVSVVLAAELREFHGDSGSLG
jgi:hypothetical protein